ALHDACYRERVAVAALTGPAGAAEDLGAVESRQRAGYARRWLGLYAPGLCWIHDRGPDGGLAEPDRSQVSAAVSALDQTAPLDRRAGRTVRAALFGTSRGPMLRTLVDLYGRAELVCALRTYLDCGLRPLRDQVLAQLHVLDSAAGEHGD
ncbi:MAG TPA: hypothetical protein VF163_02775, partial [Micromonosporaceae bacterium]